MTKEERKEYNRQYYLKNNDKMKQYYQGNKKKRAEYQKKYYQDNKDKRAEYLKQYYIDKKEIITEQQKQYHQTPIGRATTLLTSYRIADKIYNRGKCDLTAKWIVENIFPKHCHYCGEDDWTKIGCDRIDNDLPHTPGNVVPCCEKCNKKRHTKLYEEFKKEVQDNFIHTSIQ